jgi:hypothetical protein
VKDAHTRGAQKQYGVGHDGHVAMQPVGAGDRDIGGVPAAQCSVSGM